VTAAEDQVGSLLVVTSVGRSHVPPAGSGGQFALRQLNIWFPNHFAGGV
jgi:hypothetical protein